MPETLLTFQHSVVAADGTPYEARACGGEMRGGTWQAWLEFIPRTGGDALRSRRETTQPNRTDLVYWATGLSHVYLEGALDRALSKAPHAAPPAPRRPSVFSEPAPSIAHPPTAGHESVLDPFSVYEKGEALLRRQLEALSAWHLVNIALDYRLTELDLDTLNRMPAAGLIELIAARVRDTTERQQVGARRSRL